MPDYVLTYRSADPSRIPNATAQAAWSSFFEGLGDHLTKMGAPVFSATTVGNTGAGTSVGGYSFIAAESLDQAAELVRGCPLLAQGGGVEIGEITPLSIDPTAVGAAHASA
jgi:hypothetical protein